MKSTQVTLSVRLYLAGIQLVGICLAAIFKPFWDPPSSSPIWEVTDPSGPESDFGPFSETEIM